MIRSYNISIFWVKKGVPLRQYSTQTPTFRSPRTPQLPTHTSSSAEAHTSIGVGGVVEAGVAESNPITNHKSTHFDTHTNKIFHFFFFRSKTKWTL